MTTEIFKRGDVYFAELNPAIESEIKKTRPVLIVSNDLNNKYSDLLTIVPITTLKTKVYPFAVFIREGNAGLTNDSKIKCNQIRTLDKNRLKNKIGSVNEVIMGEVEKAICIHLDIGGQT